MAKSAEIKAEIDRKEKIIDELLAVRDEVANWSSSVSCLGINFSKAGELLTQSVSIDGKPVDEGRTSEMGAKFNGLSGDIESLINDINGKIADLEDEIANLKIAYQKAKEFEELQAEIAARRAAVISSKTGSTSGTTKAKQQNVIKKYSK